MEQKATAAIRRAAARNNAGWCATVCRSHGIASTVTDAAWYSLGRTPPYYPDAVTLRPDATPAHFLDRIDATSPGCSVKDSFATLDLTQDGFAELFTAQWIHRPAHLPAPPTPVLTVRRVSTAAELHDWQVAWHGDDSPVDIFRPALLSEPSVRIFTLIDRDRDRDRNGNGDRDRNGNGDRESDRNSESDLDALCGGFVLAVDDEVVGLSNLFATGNSHRPDVWAAAIAAAAKHFPGRPLVGYEQGDDLAIACANGFGQIGALRVWLHQP